MEIMNQPENKSTDREILISYVFDVRRDILFKAWTDPEHLRKWYAPHGCTIEFPEIDLREGGRFRSCIKNPAFKDCWCKGEYLEIKAPERLVYTLTATDEHGNEAEPKALGMHPEWPKITIVTVTFEENADKTLLTLHQTASESLAKETGAHPSWIQMFERLSAELI
ncbi:SRPBCC domain-containing protein [Emticicia sp. CRIBPO]|uniref:SRPBCC family protein n=1 Tax=Emticicia sp. CRIBPO TaxID=2683258 RepID=UPI00197AD55A|nr:SRPBCC domain-containing protein [Emticicia sp. CRIBPO]